MLALYVHYPYCTRRCPYCDFNVHLRRYRLEEDALLAAYAAQLDVLHRRLETRPFTSIFIGGGTPSLMSASLLARLLHHAAKRFGIAKGAEITLEANPAEASLQRMQDWRAAGATRLSLGVQSLNDDALRFYGRNHNAAQARAAAHAASRTFARWSLDMLYARPGQTVPAWCAELRAALSLGAPHYSLYQLTIEPGTAFARQTKAGRWQPPSEAQAARLYETAQETCAAAGFPAYEISNHAQSMRHYARHNWHVWRGGDYLGIGPGAVGRFAWKGRRYASHAFAAPKIWAAECRKPSAGYAVCKPLSADAVRTERVFLGLRLAKGLSHAQARRLGVLPLGARGQVLKKQGFVQADKDGLRVLPKGRLVLDELTAQLLADASGQNGAARRPPAARRLCAAPAPPAGAH